MKDVVIDKTASQNVNRLFPWVYRNEILRQPDHVVKGEIVNVRSPSGDFLGIGYVNPESTITIRILSFTERPIDREFFVEKIAKAWGRRQALLHHTNACRVIHSEADGLPGLIVDYYDGCLVIQINTAGMDRLRNDILQALAEVIEPRGVYEHSDAASREKEGMETGEGILLGDIPDDLIIVEGGVQFHVRLKESQKTGFYLDQRRNRHTVASYVREGFRVLDLFCNTGGFGIHAGLRGAGAVNFVDISATALEGAKENVRLNALKDAVTVKADAFDYLENEFRKNGRYDLVVLDPPAFAKTMSAKAGALKGYRRLMQGSLRLLKSEGYLALFSCSHHISAEDLIDVTRKAAEEADCRLEVLEHLFQDHDHPHLLNIPPSLYLKGFLFRTSSP